MLSITGSLFEVDNVESDGCIQISLNKCNKILNIFIDKKRSKFL